MDPAALAAALARVLGASEGIDLVAAGDAAPARLGLALEPWAGLAAWTRAARLDGLFLHRHRRLADWPVDRRLTVLAAHDPFDAELAMSPRNVRLREALGLSDELAMSPRDGRLRAALGHSDEGGAPPTGAWRDGEGDAAATARVWSAGAERGPASIWRERLAAVFGGLEEWHPGPGAAGGPVTRVALAGALRPELVHAAHGAGAQLYVTGAWRPAAASALARTGLALAAVGHARSERWGVRTLARVLRDELPELETTVAPPDAREVVVDGMNVIGTRPDGWWHDRPAARRRLVERLDAFALATAAQVTVVFDGRPHDTAPAVVDVRFARRAGRDAADDDIAALVAAHPTPGVVRVVTSDTRLAARVAAAGGRPTGAGALLRELDLLARAPA